MALALSENFRISTNQIYPSFKNGLYMEEAFYMFYLNNKDIFSKCNYIYIPAFWTNLQVNSNFKDMKGRLQEELDEAVKEFGPEQKFFTIVQHDDAVLLKLPKKTLVFGACSGHIPLPLIYEDRAKILESIEKLPFDDKPIQISFVGSNTHNVRKELLAFSKTSAVDWYIDFWDTPIDPSANRNVLFLSITQKSKYCLSPRGYGRSSFRFFESFLLGAIPIYIWDDIEWLPYKERINYKDICISIHTSELPKLQDIVNAITAEQYESMKKKYEEIKEYFTMFGMAKYVLEILLSNPNIPIELLSYYRGQGN